MSQHLRQAPDQQQPLLKTNDRRQTWAGHAWSSLQQVGGVLCWRAEQHMYAQTICADSGELSSEEMNDSQAIAFCACWHESFEAG